MPAIKKYGKVSRPAVLKIRNQLKRKPRSVASRNLLFEKLKANNIALARALSKEKQENKYLYSQNIALTSDLQEQQVLLNRRDGVIQDIFKNSKEGLKQLVQATNYLTSTIIACQGIISKSSANTSTRSSASRSSVVQRESNRQSISVKSPARGVVQPMVSGHTITKPVINLSRINMPRIQISPNLSDIEESMSQESDRSPVRPDLAERSVHQSNFTTRRAERLLPERITVTPPRISDEIRDFSDKRARKSSRRYSRKSSTKSPSQSQSFEARLSSSFGSTIRNPTVALHDVSKLLRKNSQSVNIRTFLDSSENDSVTNSTSPSTTVSPSSNTTQEEEEEVLQSSKGVNIESLDDSIDTFTYNYNSLRWKNQYLHSTINNNTEDPLEGPSWLYNQPQSDFTKSTLRDNTALDPPAYSPSVLDNRGSMSMDLTSQPNILNGTTMDWSCNEQSALPNASTYQHNGNDIKYDDDDNDEYDDDVCRPINVHLIMNNKNQKPDDEGNVTSSSRLSEHVTMTRGHTMVFDDDDFTLCINARPRTARNAPPSFNMDELKLPELEKPLVPRTLLEPEPEITTTINVVPQNVTRQTIGGAKGDLPMRNFDASMRFNNDTTQVSIPAIHESVEISDLASFNHQGRDSGVTYDESIINGRGLLKRKCYNKPMLSSSSDSEPSPPSGNAAKIKKKIGKRKDPSSVKVVLEKLDSTCKKNSSNDPKSALENQSDSESSNASSKTSFHRPRRQKAPTNLKEPSQRMKLRRQ